MSHSFFCIVCTFLQCKGYLYRSKYESSALDSLVSFYDVLMNFRQNLSHGVTIGKKSAPTL